MLLLLICMSWWRCWRTVVRLVRSGPLGWLVLRRCWGSTARWSRGCGAVS